MRPTLLTLACLLASPGFADDLPSLGDASSAIVSPQQEHQLGRAWLALLRSQVSQLNDPQLKDYVESSVYRLVETSQVNDRRLEFILINSPQLNAFAAPGGIVGVNGGLFLNAQTEGEYASVLAHELAHLSQRHFARGVEASQRMQVPMMAALLAGIVIAAAGAGDAGIAAIAGTQAAAIQEQRRFSRQNEQEADRIGIMNLEKGRLRSALDADHVRTTDAPVPLRRQAPRIPADSPGDRIADRRHSQPRRTGQTGRYRRQHALPADSGTRAADL